MSCCCSSYVNIGCANFCTAIDTTFEAVQNGTHTVEAYIVNGAIQDITLGVLTIGDPMIIPASTLNENKANDIKILQPDGTYYAFTAAIDCLRLTTQVHLTLQDIIT